MPIIAAYMVPHPPMIVPAVGRGSEAQIEATTCAYQHVAEEIAEIAPDTIIITSPHSVMYADYFHISPGASATGSFAGFGAPEVRFNEEYDEDLALEISTIASTEGFPAGLLGQRPQDIDLDHGTMVPLYFIRQKYRGGRLVRIGLSGLPLTEHYALGEIIQQAVRELKRRVVFVASGDLSHKLQDYGPYGFAPEGPEYDRRIMDVCSRAAFGELFGFRDACCEKAAECGHRSFVIMAGALDGMPVEARQLSHEDVTGVGYGICTFRPVQPEHAADASRRFRLQYIRQLEAEAAARADASDDYVRLARRSLEAFILRGETIEPPEGLPEEMTGRRAGAFVSIHKDGALRGCIGTIAPTRASVAEEIIRNAISASTEDPRFPPICPEELGRLDISVDVLGEPEPILSEDDLDVKRYGVIVTSGSQRGLLLPDLDGVDTPAQQVAIARRKAGIRDGKPVKLERFEVIRHH
jgi:AmmeMemoRadiSam system protein A